MAGSYLIGLRLLRFDEKDKEILGLFKDRMGFIRKPGNV